MNSYDKIYTLLLEGRPKRKRIPKRRTPPPHKDVKPKLLKKGEGLVGQAHDQLGHVDKKEASRNFRALERPLRQAGEEGKDLWFGREGDVEDTPVERKVKRYGRMFGIKVHGGSLEDPRTDPKIKGNKADRFIQRRVGKDKAEAGRHSFLRGAGTKVKPSASARRGLDAAGVPRKQHNDPDTLFAKSFAVEDFPKEKPDFINTDQQIRNRLRRTGVRSKLKKIRKQGMIPVGTFGKDHVKESLLQALQLRREV
jgi:hypothetical protein